MPQRRRYQSTFPALGTELLYRCWKPLIICDRDSDFTNRHISMSGVPFMIGIKYFIVNDIALRRRAMFHDDVGIDFLCIDFETEIIRDSSHEREARASRGISRSCPDSRV